MKTKWGIPIIAGVGMIAGAAIVAFTEVRRLKKVILFKDETIDNLNEMNQSLQEDLEGIEDDLEMLEEHEVFIEYLKDCIDVHLKTIDSQRTQIVQLENRIKHFDGAVVARVVRKKANEKSGQNPKVLVSCRFVPGSTSGAWQLENSEVKECYLNNFCSGDESIVPSDWREELKFIAKEKKWEMDLAVLKDVRSALIYLNDKGFFLNMEGKSILDEGNEFYGLVPCGAAIIANSNGEPFLAIWEI